MPVRIQMDLSHVEIKKKSKKGIKEYLSSSTDSDSENDGIDDSYLHVQADPNVRLRAETEEDVLLNRCQEL